MNTVEQIKFREGDHLRPMKTRFSRRLLFLNRAKDGSSFCACATTATTSNNEEKPVVGQ
jgi:hypothetical protein